MAQGKLLAVGTNEFMKKNFGVGYHLKISLKDGLSDDNQVKEFPDKLARQIQDIVFEQIQKAELFPQTNKDEIVFMIPFNYQKHFSNLFDHLEQVEGINVNLEMNSLEDAFINIGMDEDKFLRERVRNSKDINKATSQLQVQASTPNGDQPNLQNVRKSLEEKYEAKYTNFDRIKKPRCLADPPVYRFSSQFAAVFLRKYYYTVRSLSAYIAVILPLAIMISLCIVIDNISQFRGDYPTQMVFLSGISATAYSFNCGAYVTLPVMEREHNLKYALNVMGCRVFPYWCGTFVFDYLMYLMTMVIFFFTMTSTGTQFVIFYIAPIAIIMLTFGFSYICFSYMCGFMFKKSNSALKG